MPWPADLAAETIVGGEGRPPGDEREGGGGLHEPDDGRTVEVGSLGRLRLERGAYLYVGSALGPGGVGARVGRHCRRDGPLHWHVDHLSRRAAVRRVWYTLDPERREHDWARILEDLPGSTVPLSGFGASDCGCDSHLFRFDRAPGPERFRRAARDGIPGHGPILTASAS